MATNGDLPYSLSRRAGNLLFVSGQLGRDDQGRYSDGVTAQTRTAMENLQRALQQEGVGLDDLVKVQVFLSDIEDWAEVTAEYVSWFTGPLPARSAFKVGLPAEALVEIEGIALLP